jgi:hypothetical protein
MSGIILAEIMVPNPSTAINRIVHSHYKKCVILDQFIISKAVCRYLPRVFFNRNVPSSYWYRNWEDGVDYNDILLTIIAFGIVINDDIQLFWCKLIGEKIARKVSHVQTRKKIASLVWVSTFLVFLCAMVCLTLLPEYPANELLSYPSRLHSQWEKGKRERR